MMVDRKIAEEVREYTLAMKKKSKLWQRYKVPKTRWYDMPIVWLLKLYGYDGFIMRDNCVVEIYDE